MAAYTAGGARLDGRGPIDLTNCNFSGNEVVRFPGEGGAIYVRGSSAIFQSVGNIFVGNFARGDGGTIFAQFINILMIDRSMFISNRAGSSGGVISSSDTVSVMNSSFINNTAFIGGVVHTSSRFVNVSLVGSVFSNNSAISCGVVYVEEYGFIQETYRFINSTFNRNVATVRRGGVGCIRNADILVSNSTFADNSAATNAGVFSLENSQLTIVDSTFDDNTAGERGGALHTYLSSSNFTISRSSFTNNEAGSDGGVLNVGRAGSRVSVNESVFGYNRAAVSGGIVAINGSSVDIENSLVFNNTARYGSVLSACNGSDVTGPDELFILKNPYKSTCTLYDEFERTYALPTTTSPVVVSSHTTGSANSIIFSLSAAASTTISFVQATPNGPRSGMIATTSISSTAIITTRNLVPTEASATYTIIRSTTADDAITTANFPNRVDTTSTMSASTPIELETSSFVRSSSMTAILPTSLPRPIATTQEISMTTTQDVDNRNGASSPQRKLTTLIILVALCLVMVIFYV